jgi:hypothetical protein
MSSQEPLYETREKLSNNLSEKLEAEHLVISVRENPFRIEAGSVYLWDETLARLIFLAAIGLEIQLALPSLFNTNAGESPISRSISLLIFTVLIVMWISHEIYVYVRRKSEVERASAINTIRKEYKEIFDLLEGELIKLLRQGSLKK